MAPSRSDLQILGGHSELLRMFRNLGRMMVSGGRRRTVVLYCSKVSNSIISENPNTSKQQQQIYYGQFTSNSNIQNLVTSKHQLLMLWNTKQTWSHLGITDFKLMLQLFKRGSRIRNWWGGGNYIELSCRTGWGGVPQMTSLVASSGHHFQDAAAAALSIAWEHAYGLASHLPVKLLLAWSVWWHKFYNIHSPSKYESTVKLALSSHSLLKLWDPKQLVQLNIYVDSNYNCLLGTAHPV